MPAGQHRLCGRAARASAGERSTRIDARKFASPSCCPSTPARRAQLDRAPGAAAMLERLEQQKKLTANQWRIILTTNLDDMLDFFDFF